ncbi:hypothetical protein [Chromobacterium haemolyticum]|uniref:hypothetical protein n=1 Tax=Chromobacterium haemolyticum TaxID=394935 RepID=UPI00131744FB|nr:hypothetical protein [Chromobacterium haemolyticum]BBH13410.1 hypothetical protein CH06BL_26580 [Chromobacterium haemolyticum]
MDLTNESWSYVTHSWEETSILDAAGTRVAVIRISSEVIEDNQQELEYRMEAQARRIVACVNALVGWDTATLERYAQGGAPGNPNLGQMFSELNIAREQRDQAWAELRAIREAIGANPEESTLDEVASKLTYNDEAVSKLISQRDNLLSALELMVERIAEPPDANCSCHLSPPCNDCVDYGGEREAFETAKAEIAEARNAK